MGFFKRVKEWVRWHLPYKLIYGRKSREIVASHARVADYWDKVIADYQEGRIQKYRFEPKADLDDKPVIWQYWGQGVKESELPEVVKICFDSVDKFAGDYKVIRLCDETISEYLDMPQWVVDKVQDGTMRRVFFSDLLRVALLSAYGGVWLDATILMTGSVPLYMSNRDAERERDADHFCYQRDPNEAHQNQWMRTFVYYFNWDPNFQVNMLNSILWSKRGSEMMQVTVDLLLHYWSEQKELPSEYFFFQILYNRLVNGAYAHLRPKVVSDCPPHILHMLIRGAKLPYSYGDALAQSTLHKLTYFNDREIEELRRVLGEL